MFGQSAGDVGLDGLGVSRRARLARRLYCFLDHGSFLSFRMVGCWVSVEVWGLIWAVTREVPGV